MDSVFFQREISFFSCVLLSVKHDRQIEHVASYITYTIKYYLISKIIIFAIDDFHRKQYFIDLEF